MTPAAKKADVKNETLAPYIFFGIFLGLLTVFSALVITRLPL